MMSDSKTPRPTSLWGFVMWLLGCAVALWIVVKIIESTWGWLLIIAGTVLLAAVLVLIVRRWWHRGRW